ncbi:MAG: hypothetical protein V3U30_01250 [Thermoplasmata archaeon]
MTSVARRTKARDPFFTGTPFELKRAPNKNVLVACYGWARSRPGDPERANPGPSWNLGVATEDTLKIGVILAIIMILMFGLGFLLVYLR